MDAFKIMCILNIQQKCILIVHTDTCMCSFHCFRTFAFSLVHMSQVNKLFLEVGVSKIKVLLTLFLDGTSLCLLTQWNNIFIFILFSCIYEFMSYV